MAPCKNQGGGVLIEPHDSRWTCWGLNPNMRAKVTLDTWVRWDETFGEWAKRMIIHCPTARTVGELMFFAAEKLDMTTVDYLTRYFPELKADLLSKHVKQLGS